MKFLSYITAFLVMAGSTCFGQGMRISAYPNTNNLGFSNLFIVAIKGSPGTNMNISWAQLSNLLHTTVGGQFILENSGVGTNTSIYNSLNVTGSNVITGNLGVGTNIPWSRLHVVGDNNQYYTFIVETTNKQGLIVVNTNGITGIGTNFPKARLHIVGENNFDLFRVDSTNLHALLVVTTNGNVGIGTNAPQALLDVFGTHSGNGYLFRVGSGNVANGTNVLSTDTNGLTVVKLLDSQGRITIATNVALRYRQDTNTVADLRYIPGDSLIFGNGGLFITTNAPFPVDPLPVESNGLWAGKWNTFIGMDTGVSNTSGNCNTFVGSGAGQCVTIADQETYVGAAAGQSMVDGFHNSFLGCGAGWAMTNGAYNAFFGTDCAIYSPTGQYNSFFGNSVGTSNAGSYNSFFGSLAGANNLSGSYNLYMGSIAGNKNIDGIGNVAIGIQSYDKAVTGNYNTALGANSARVLYTGHSNIFIGSYADSTANGSTNLFNAVAIGAGATVASNNSIVLGNPSTTLTMIPYGNVGIGTNAPAATLHVGNGGDLAVDSSVTAMNGAAYITSSTASNAMFGATAGRHLYLLADNVLKSVLTTNGNFAIGYEGVWPTAKLVVDHPAPGLNGIIAKFNGADNADSETLLGFSYRQDPAANPPASLGYRIDTDGWTGLSKGSLVFKTRSVTTDTAPSERMRISSTGLVGIGTNNPAATFHVAGNNAQNVAQFGTTNRPSQVTISTNGVLSVNPGGGLNPVGCYGFLGMNDTNLIVCTGAAGVYTNVAGQDGFTTITTNGFFGNTAAIAAGLTNLYPGWYRVTVCLSALGANNQALEGEVFTNGVACDLIGFKKTYDAAARMDDMSTTGIIYLPANCGTQFMLQDGGTGGSVIVHRASLTVGTP